MVIPNKIAPILNEIAEIVPWIKYNVAKAKKNPKTDGIKMIIGM